MARELAASRPPAKTNGCASKSGTIGDPLPCRSMESLKELYAVHGQAHVFEGYERLADDARKELEGTLASLNPARLNEIFHSSTADDAKVCACHSRASVHPCVRVLVHSCVPPTLPADLPLLPPRSTHHSPRPAPWGCPLSR